MRAEISGSLTDAGTAASRIGSWAVLDADGADVTDRFTDAELLEGTLTVEPAPLYVWTGSAEKTRDGTPLTCADVAVGAYPGAAEDGPAWRDLAYAGADGETRTLYGLCGSVAAHALSPLTGEPADAALKAGEKLTVWLNGDGGVTLKVERTEAAVLPEDVIRLYADNPDFLERAAAELDGTGAEALRARIGALEPDGRETAERFGLVTRADAGAARRAGAANARVTVGTLSAGERALRCGEADFAAAAAGGAVRAAASGSLTEAGECPNTYTIDWNGEDPANYELREDLGTLRVLAAHAGQTTSGGADTSDTQTESTDGCAHGTGRSATENYTDATCTAEGSYEAVVYCTVCGEELSRTRQTIPAKGHTPGAAQREKYSSPTCDDYGEYDEVVYCTVCGGELSRTYVEIPKTGNHTPNSPVQENYKAPTCGAGGYDMVIYCAVCYRELSSEHVTLPGTGKHKTDGTATQVNYHAPTETEEGSYDMVMYCTVCGEEVSRTHVTIPRKSLQPALPAWRTCRLRCEWRRLP